MSACTLRERRGAGAVQTVRRVRIRTYSVVAVAVSASTGTRA